jgi:uncharacterized protein YjbJ (UPF0337 family)
MNTKTQQWKGRIKQAAGTLTGNKKLESEGRADRRAADSLGDVIDTATDSLRRK